MKRGFYTIMAAQFFSSLADNALLVAAIALLLQLRGPEWMVPLLKFFFVVSYVALAAFVGAFADSMPKGRVMFITNMIKIGGCMMMLFYEQLTAPGLAPYSMVLVAYAVVGLGAAAYSPAKYGILTELLPAEQLVVANGWIEATTVGSIILGTVLGGAVIGPKRLEQDLFMARKDFGAVLSGPAAWSVLVYGLPTLGLRIREQEKTAGLVAEMLLDHPRVKEVRWPGLDGYRWQNGVANVLSTTIVARRLRGRRIAPISISSSVGLTGVSK